MILSFVFRPSAYLSDAVINVVINLNESFYHDFLKCFFPGIRVVHFQKYLLKFFFQYWVGSRGDNNGGVCRKGPIS